MDEFYVFALIGASVTMMLAFLIAQRTNSSGYIDTIWSFCVGGFGIAAIFFVDGPQFIARHMIIIGLLSAWSLRLGGYIFFRSNAAPDDPRYAYLRKQWGKNAARNLFVFLQIQAICAFVLIVAAKLAVTKPTQEISPIDALAALICIGSIFGESIADAQLKKFRSNKNNGVCNIGLWKLSRHPNYFFEFLFWLGFALFAVDINISYFEGLAAFCAPALIYWLLNFASGIPPLEAHMIRSRGEAYLEYQRTTRPFLPFPKSKS
jgi:steroid 5-alpha reductase family enzyme